MREPAISEPLDLAVPPTTVPIPAPGVCDVWFSVLREGEGELGWLSAEEQVHANRLRPEISGRYVAGRAVQRRILAQYIGSMPEAVSIHRGRAGERDAGRPQVPGAGFDFNVSHSGRLFVIAVVGTGRVGIDLEHTVEADCMADIIPTALNEREQKELSRHAPMGDRRAAFTTFWCRKEATLKMSGHGIAIPLTEIDVVDDIVTFDSSIDEWSGSAHLTSLEVPKGSIGAIATTNPVSAIRRRFL